MKSREMGHGGDLVSRLQGLVFMRLRLDHDSWCPPWIVEDSMTMTWNHEDLESKEELLPKRTMGAIKGCGPLHDPFGWS